MDPQTLRIGDDVIGRGGNFTAIPYLPRRREAMDLSEFTAIGWGRGSPPEFIPVKTGAGKAGVWGPDPAVSTIVSARPGWSVVCFE